MPSVNGSSRPSFDQDYWHARKVWEHLTLENFEIVRNLTVAELPPVIQELVYLFISMIEFKNMGGQDVEYLSGQETVHPAYINAKVLRYHHRSITDEAAQLLVSLLTSHPRQVILTSIIGLIQIRDR